MKLLAKWPIPEVVAYLMAGVVASYFVNSWPTLILASAVAGFGITVVSAHLRDI